MITLAALLLAAVPLSGQPSDCPASMAIPLFACRRGTATASVAQLPDATYVWSAQGATIVDGAQTNRVKVALGDEPLARLSCTIVTPSCTSITEGVVSVREPLVLGALQVPQTIEANDPVTITWTYEGAAQPVSQVVTGDALAAPVALAGDVRSYTFTPVSSGDKTIELRGTYAPVVASSTPPPAGKRRSVGSSTVGASACPDAHVSARVNVHGCKMQTPAITAPSTAETNVPFYVTVDLPPGETAHWTVANATIVSDSGSRIAVRAEQEGEARITVRVESDPSCFAESSVTVRIKPRPAECTASPAASVELVDVTCEKATVRVTLTGKPPWRGYWLDDGTVFGSNDGVATKSVTAYGRYGVREFTDGNNCRGVVSNSVTFQRTASVRLEMPEGACTNEKMVVKLTGKPPFEGLIFKGTRGEAFKTNSNEIVFTSQEYGDYYAQAKDSECTTTTMSNRVSVWQPAPRLELYGSNPYCQFYAQAPVTVVMTIQSSSLPFTVNWTDGVITKQTTPEGLYRRFTTPTVPMQRYDIASAWGSDCRATVAQPAVYVTYRPVEIDQTKTDEVVCPGKDAFATLGPGVASNANVQWTVENADIVSGQGTSSIRYRSRSAMTWARIWVSATYPDGACAKDDIWAVHFAGEALVRNVRWEPATIKPGGTSTLRFDRNIYLGNQFRATLPDTRAADLGAWACLDTSCWATFKDTKGAGTVPATITWTAECGAGEQSLSSALTITP